jgi:hypothetical protein
MTSFSTESGLLAGDPRGRESVAPRGSTKWHPVCQPCANLRATAHRAVESLDVGVPLRASPLDEGLPDLLPGQSRPLVGAQQPRLSVAGKEVFELGDHISRGDTARDAAAERKPRVLVDDVQDPKRPPVVGTARHEVVRPDVGRPDGGGLPDRILGAALASFARLLRRGGTLIVNDHDTPSGANRGGPYTPVTSQAVRLLSGRDGCAEVGVVGHGRSVEHQRLARREVDHLVARVLDDLADALALHDVDGAPDGYRASDEVGHYREMVVLVQSESGDAIDVVRGVLEVLDGPQRVPFGVEPDLRTVVEKTDEVVVEGPRQVKRRAVDGVAVLEIELEPLRRGRSGRVGGDHEQRDKALLR